MDEQYWQRVYHNMQRRLRRQFLMIQLTLVVLGISLGVAIRQESSEIGIAFMVSIVSLGILSGFLLRFIYLGADPLIIIGTVTDMQWIYTQPPIKWLEIDIHDAFYVDSNGHLSDSKRCGRQRIDTNGHVYNNLVVRRPARIVCTHAGKAIYLLEEVE